MSSKLCSVPSRFVCCVQVVLDENVQAEGAEYCDIADVSPSPGDHRLAAYAADMTGYEVGACVRFVSLSLSL